MCPAQNPQALSAYYCRLQSPLGIQQGPQTRRKLLGLAQAHAFLLSNSVSGIMGFLLGGQKLWSPPWTSSCSCSARVNQQIPQALNQQTPQALTSCPTSPPQVQTSDTCRLLVPPDPSAYSQHSSPSGLVKRPVRSCHSYFRILQCLPISLSARVTTLPLALKSSHSSYLSALGLLSLPASCSFPNTPQLAFKPPPLPSKNLYENQLLREAFLKVRSNLSFF